MEIDTTKISKNAEDYEQKRKELEMEYKKVVNSINNLKSSWSGNRGSNFFAATDEFLPEFKKAIDSLSDYYSYLFNVPKVYSAFDNSYKNKKIDV